MADRSRGMRISIMTNSFEIGPARADEMGNLELCLDRRRFTAGEKYTILEMGWAVYLASGEIPKAWMDRYGETRPAEEGGYRELASGEGSLVTSHPILVALSLRAWWHRNGRPIPTTPYVPIPTFDEAFEEVRTRPILNDFNAVHAGTVPGLRRWREQSA